MALPLSPEVKDILFTVVDTSLDFIKGDLIQDNNRIKSKYSNDFLKEDDILKFPIDLGTDNTTSNIIRFSIMSYEAGGYNKLHGDGTSDEAKKPKGKRIIDIYLALPGGLGVKNKAKWDVTSDISGAAASLTGAATGAITALQGKGGLSDVFNMFRSGIGQSFANLGSSGIDFLVNNGINLFLNSNETLNNSLAVGAGINMHPYEETIYKGPDFRSFSYSFNLVPRNKLETKMISDIIQSFRWATSPGISNLTQSDGKFDISGLNLLSYPNVFYIEYLIPKNKESLNSDNSISSLATASKLIKNPWLNRLHPCICSDVSVEFGSQSKNYNSYDDGAPLTCKLTLTFAELIFVTKTNINQGY